MKVGILGGNGLLGSDLVAYLSSSFDVTSITRENYKKHGRKRFDLFINANGNSRRYWALQNVFSDFEASTVSVYKTLFDFKFKKYIYISSVDVYPDPSSPKKTAEDSDIDINKQNSYGFHKYLSEQIVKKHVTDWLILRPSSILGTSLKKGPLFDILDSKPIFITLDSQLQYITANSIAEIIKVLFKQSTTCQIFNVGGIGVFDFADIDKYFNQEIQVSPEAKKQVYEMNVKKLKKIYPSLKKSEEYLEEFLKGCQTQQSTCYIFRKVLRLCPHG